MAMIDFRRTDERNNIRPNPFWVRSARMNWDGKVGFTAVMDDNEAVFMSFPKGGKGVFPVVIQAVIVEILTAFVGGTPAIAIGSGTIPTLNSTDGDTVTVTAANSIMATAVVLPAATGEKLAYPLLVPFIVTPADATTPVFLAALTSGSPITDGALRINMLVSEAN